MTPRSVSLTMSRANRLFESSSVPLSQVGQGCLGGFLRPGKALI
jgi:hypothetical protein